MSRGPDGTDSAVPAGGRATSGTGGPVPEWTRRLRPPVPPEVASLLARAGDGSAEAAAPSAPSTEALAEAAGAALDHALSGDGSRNAAWHLLAADALLTLACETALDGARADGTLEVMVRRVVVGPPRRKESGDRD